LVWAAGHGFTRPPEDELGPAVAEFLQQKRMRLAPEEVSKPSPRGGLWYWDGYRFYVLGLVAGLWRAFGISWPALKVLSLLLYCATIPAVYGLFRLGMGRVLSAAGTALFMLSPAVLEMLPRLRDFSKAPFILAAMLIMAHMTQRRGGLRRLVLLAAVLGVVCGLGLGFRQDVFVCPFIGMLVLALGARTQRRLRLRHRALAMAVLLLAFAVAAAPILFAMLINGGAISSHDMMMGFGSPPLREAGLQPASYVLIHSMRDDWVHATRVSYHQRVNNVSTPIRFDCPEATPAAIGFTAAAARTFPADLMVRLHGATRTIVADPRMLMGWWTSSGDGDALVSALRRFYAPVAGHLERFGLYYVAAALLVLAARDLHGAWAVALLLVCFCGYTTIQFQLRHCFHLGFIALWAAGYLLNALRGEAERRWRAGKGAGGPAELSAGVARGGWGPVRRMLLFAVPAMLLATVPLSIARAYQRGQVAGLFEQCAGADLEPLETEAVQHPDGLLFRPVSWPADVEREQMQPFYDTVSGLIAPSCPGDPLVKRRLWPHIDDFCHPPELHRGQVRTEYLVAEFRTREAAHHGRERRAQMLYEPEPDGTPMSLEPFAIELIPPGGRPRTRYFFPVYEFTWPFGSQWGYFRFDGLLVPHDQAGDFAGLYRVGNLEDFGFLPNVCLRDDLETMRYFVTLGDRDGP